MRKLIGIIALSCVAVAANAQTYFFGASLDTAQEVANPPVTTSAFGAGGIRVVVDTNGRIYYEGMVRVRMLSSAPTVFHIHLAERGVNGGVAVGFDMNFNVIQDLGGGNYNIYVRGQIVDRTVNGTPFTRLQIVEEMRAGRAYFNIHNATYPGGEIRGQIAEIVN